MDKSESTPPSFNPPSFRPQRKSVRPVASGAKRIGTPTSPLENPPAQPASEQSSNYRLRSLPAKSHSETPSEHPQKPQRISAFQSHAEEYVKTHPTQRHRSSLISENHASPEHKHQENNVHCFSSQTPNPPTYPPRYAPRSGSSPQSSAYSKISGSYKQNQHSADIIHNVSSHQSFTRPQEKDRTLSNSRIKKRRIKRRILLSITALLALIIIIPIAWGIHLYNYGNANLTHTEALSGAPDTAGTTYLIVGSDQREVGSSDPTEGMRSDTIMLLHKPTSGAPALVSLPRDAWVEIPDNGEAKLNAAFSWGGPQLLVQTVENLTGFTIDHYVQIGMSGVKDLTNAVGGVNLCLDYEVNDPESELVWPPVEGAEPGCFDVNGDQALAFSRMRKADPLGDIGRTNRQRQVVGAILHKALTKDILLSPSKQKNLVGNTAQALTVDTNDSIANIGFAGLALRDVMGEGGLLGAPPIADMAYWTSDGQSAVLLDPDKIDEFWAKMAEGTLTADDFYSPQL